MDKLRTTPSKTQVVLSILAEIGTGTIKAFFPHPYYHTFCQHGSKQSLYSATKRLREAGLIVKKADIFYLTEKGEKEAFWANMNLEFHSYSAKKKIPPKWDGKWRIIFFDVPEKKKQHRNYLRSIIKGVGFKEFQKSIWVYPHKVPDFLIEILQEDNILPYTRFLTTNNIDYDDDLKSMFSL